MSRKVISVGAVVVLLTTSIAFAQVTPLPDNSTKLTKEEQERAAADRAYKESSKTVPAPKGSADPWGSLRPSPSPGPAASPAVAGKNKP
jgi:hypothetical protein